MSARRDTNTKADTPTTRSTPSRQTRRLRVWLVVFPVVNAADLLTTLLVMRLGGYEANTLPALIVAHLGAAALIPLKLAGTAALSAVLAIGWRSHPQTRWLTICELQAYCLVLALITANNLYTIALQLSNR